jgi:L-ectoine synthase
MIVERLENITGSPQEVSGTGWSSRRLLLKRHGLGYSLSDTLIEEGAEITIEFKNHVETNYCFEGEGEVEDLRTGEVHPLRPGTVYTLDQHDPHILRCHKGPMRLVCVFTPALTGPEHHEGTGSYELLD